jgi:predicted transcriptional regulator
MSRDCVMATVDEPLEKALQRIREAQCATAPVVQDGRLVGLLTLENIGELVMVNSALGHVDDTGRFSRSVSST